MLFKRYHLLHLLLHLLRQRIKLLHSTFQLHTVHLIYPLSRALGVEKVLLLLLVLIVFCLCVLLQQLYDVSQRGDFYLYPIKPSLQFGYHFPQTITQ